MEMQTPETPATDPADIVIAQAEARHRRRLRLLVGLAAVSLSVGYPLSAGPLVVIHQSEFCPKALQPPIEFLLTPLEWANMNSEWVYSFYKWYLPYFGVE